ncbi:hypothetical protein GL2_09820 [Microbulbifer sp. GL-2]|nr:hypothetical protein GL2_09820 [Microbulbifer sp. GL-2]
MHFNTILTNLRTADGQPTAMELDHLLYKINLGFSNSKNTPKSGYLGKNQLSEYFEYVHIELTVPV